MRIPDDDLPRWREASRIAARARETGLRLLVPGARRRDVAEAIEAVIRSAGARPSFPANLSRNDEAAHYTPGPEDTVTFSEGDLVKVDVGAHLDGAIADTADTVEVGGGRRHAHLIRAVHDALRDGIAAVRPGGPVDRVSAAIAEAIRGLGLRPVEDLTGHSIEPYLLHGPKAIPNVPGRTSAHFEEGEIVAIEPFATNGIGRIENGPYGNIQRFRADPGPSDPVLARLYQQFRTLPFTLRWVDEPGAGEALRRGRRHLQTYPVFLERAHGLVAQAEHTVRVGPNGAEVLSAAPPD